MDKATHIDSKKTSLSQSVKLLIILLSIVAILIILVVWLFFSMYQVIDFNPARAMDQSSDGQLIVAGFEDGVIRVYDADSLELKSEFPVHDVHILFLKIFPDDTKILSHSFDEKLIVTDLATGEILETLTDIDAVDIAVSPDGSLIAACDWDGNLWFWDTENYKKFQSQAKGSMYSGYDSVVFNPDGSTLLACNSVMQMDIIDVETTESIAKSDFGPLEVCYSPDGSFIAGADYEADRLIIFNPVTIERTNITPIPVDDGFILNGAHAIGCSHDGQYAVANYWNEKIVIWDIETCEVVKTFNIRVRTDIPQLSHDNQYLIYYHKELKKIPTGL